MSSEVVLIHNGNYLTTHSSYDDAVQFLEWLQGNTVENALAHDGYAITQTKCECGANITENDNDGEMCTACYAEYWSKWCEECGADPDEACATGCVNEKVGA
jgi:hypothetical protein